MGPAKCEMNIAFIGRKSLPREIASLAVPTAVSFPGGMEMSRALIRKATMTHGRPHTSAVVAGMKGLGSSPTTSNGVGGTVHNETS